MKISRLAVIALVSLVVFAGSVALKADPPATTTDTPATSPAPTPAQGLPSHFWMDLVAAFAFGLLVIVLVLLSYKVIDWALRGVDFDAELTKGNMAVGVVVAAIVLGMSLSVSQVVVAIVR
jgi:putative membrane protein